jgi:anti-sigma factor RsiW
MSNSPYDLREYLFDELTPEQRREVEQYLKTSGKARDELEQLKTTQSALLSVPDEEVPRRIAFVSDKVFEPSLGLRLWRQFWDAAPRLAFGLAAILLVMFAGLWWVQPSLTVDRDRWTLAFGEQAHRAASPAMPAGMAEQLLLQVQQAVEESEIRQEQIMARLVARQGTESASAWNAAVAELGEDSYQAWRMRRNRLRSITRSAQFDLAADW